MPGYQYLDNNIWQGAGGSAQGASDAFTRAVVGLQQLRYQQAMQQRQEQMQRMQFELEQQKFLEGKNQFQQQFGLDKMKTEAEVPKLTAEAGSFNASSAFDKARTQDLQGKGQASGVLGDVLGEMVMTDPNQNPMLMQALRSIAAAQQGRLIQGSPANIPSNVSQIMLQNDPNAVRIMGLGYPPNNPQMDAGTRIRSDLVETVAKSMLRPEVTTTPLGKRSVVNTGPASQYIQQAVPWAMTGSNYPSNFSYDAPPLQSGAPMTATNPQTGEKIVSYDGGMTWQPVAAPLQ